jgi:hypothetical protein
VVEAVAVAVAVAVAPSSRAVSFIIVYG